MQNSTGSVAEPSSVSDLGRALLAYGEARRVAAADARRALSLNELDARALLFVAENPGARPSHVRDHLGITSAGVTTLIDRLVQRGAVRRDLDEEDRRVNHITAIVDLDAEPWRALTAFDAAIETAIEDVPAATAAELTRILDRIVGLASRD